MAHQRRVAARQVFLVRTRNPSGAERPVPRWSTTSTRSRSRPMRANAPATIGYIARAARPAGDQEQRVCGLARVIAATRAIDSSILVTVRMRRILRHAQRGAFGRVSSEAVGEFEAAGLKCGAESLAVAGVGAAARVVVRPPPPRRPALNRDRRRTRRRASASPGRSTPVATAAGAVRVAVDSGAHGVAASLQYAPFQGP